MKTNQILALLAVVGGVTAAFTNHSEHNNLYPDWKFQKEHDEGNSFRFISATHLADLIFYKEQDILIFDTRDRSDYEKYHIPLAMQYDEHLVSKAGLKSGIIVLYGEEGNTDMFELSHDLPGRVYLLKGGMEAWNRLVLFPDFMQIHVRNSDQLDHILRRSGFFGGKPLNTQILNINVRESRYREGC